jgi:hypothetical protein
MLSYYELTMEFSPGEFMGSIYLSNLNMTQSNLGSLGWPSGSVSRVPLDYWAIFGHVVFTFSNLFVP